MALPTETLFSDFSINFEPHPVTGLLTRLTNNDAVKQAVKILVLTNHYERFFRPELGSNVTYHLFELMIPETADDIRNAIETVLNNFEDRIKLIDVDVSTDPEANGFTASIVFMVEGETDPVDLTVFLERIR
tara:strand:+ start:4416 stop:4811 length:396 start_codon:yes stop_codon:yes gene_type:complete